VVWNVLHRPIGTAVIRLCSDGITFQRAGNSPIHTPLTGFNARGSEVAFRVGVSGRREGVLRHNRMGDDELTVEPQCKKNYYTVSGG